MVRMQTIWHFCIQCACSCIPACATCSMDRAALVEAIRRRAVGTFTSIALYACTPEKAVAYGSTVLATALNLLHRTVSSARCFTAKIAIVLSILTHTKLQFVPSAVLKAFLEHALLTSPSYFRQQLRSCKNSSAVN